jgi:hypothetical protein
MELCVVPRGAVSTATSDVQRNANCLVALHLWTGVVCICNVQRE